MKFRCLRAIGGGFDRHLEVDGVVRAVEIAKQVDGPVKVVWTHEEDIQHDMIPTPPRARSKTYALPNMHVEYVRAESPGISTGSGAASANRTTCSWSRASSTSCRAGPSGGAGSFKQMDAGSRQWEVNRKATAQFRGALRSSSRQRLVLMVWRLGRWHRRR